MISDMVARWEFSGGACVVATSCAMLMANKSRWIYKSCCYWSFMEKEEAIRRWRRVGRHRRIGGGCARPSPATWSDINLVIKEEALHWSPAGFLLPDNTLGYACIQASQLSLFARVFLKVCNESFFGSEKKIEDSRNLGEEEDRLILITNISNNLLQIAITIIGHIYFTNISGLYL